MSDLSHFFAFMGRYVWSRLIVVAEALEVVKDTAVGILLFKRGKYAISLINSSFIILTIVLRVTVPIVAQNSPFSQETLFSENVTYTGVDRLIALDEAEISLDTIRSEVRDSVELYTVQEGDSLASIAKQFQISEKTIRWANGLKNTQLTTGSALKIPPVSGVVHQVAEGDTIYSVAKKYGVSAQNIVNFPFNEFRDDAFGLIVSSSLMVPEGSLIESSQTPAQDTYAFAQVVEGVRGSSSFIWPTRGSISQYPAPYHMAYDIADNSLPAILASDAGTIIYSGCFSWGYGCHIIVDHNNGYKTLYAHLSRRDVEQGSVVSQGQQIGVMGSTGRSTGPHLHFEIRQGNVLLNPQAFLQ